MSVIAGIDLIMGNDPFPSSCICLLWTAKQKADVVIDFSRHDAIEDLLTYCVKAKVPVVIATTGLGIKNWS